MTRAKRIHDALSDALRPEILIIEDESNRHNVPANAESHFKVIAVSSCFQNLTRIARHRNVNKIVHAEFTLGLHALSLHLYTPQEWMDKESIPDSPHCRGGQARNKH